MVQVPQAHPQLNVMFQVYPQPNVMFEVYLQPNVMFQVYLQPNVMFEVGAVAWLHGCTQPNVMVAWLGMV